MIIWVFSANKSLWEVTTQAESRLKAVRVMSGEISFELQPTK